MKLDVEKLYHHHAYQKGSQINVVVDGTGKRNVER